MLYSPSSGLIRRSLRESPWAIDANKVNNAINFFRKGGNIMENYEINFEEIEELEDMEIPAGSGFGCNCGSGASLAKK